MTNQGLFGVISIELQRKHMTRKITTYLKLNELRYFFAPKRIARFLGRKDKYSFANASFETYAFNVLS